MKIVRVSPKGQITIPKEYRTKVATDQYSFEQEDGKFVLRPITVQVIRIGDKEEDELKDFGKLSEKSFEFWNNEDDDIYQNFYNQSEKWN